MKYGKDISTRVVCENGTYSVRVVREDKEGDVDAIGDILLSAPTYSELLKLVGIVNEHNKGAVIVLNSSNRDWYRW